MKLGVAVVAGLVGFMGLDALYAWYQERNRIPRVVKALERGSHDLVVIQDDTYFPRPTEEAMLRPILKPIRGGNFHLITGEHGTGTHPFLY